MQKLKKYILIAGKILVWIFLAYAVLFSVLGTAALCIAAHYILQPIRQVRSLKYENPKESTFIADYRKAVTKDGKPDSLFRIFVPLDSISPNLQSAVIAAEDDAFYTHPGFDIKAMLEAIEYNQSHNKIQRGASTITQQLAKNLFLNGKKSFLRKYKELAYTLLMETILGKKRILELYLNYAQWGKQHFGCEAASRYYYGKPSSRLSMDEASRLAAVLAAPAKLNPLNTKSVFLQKRLSVIANNLYLRSHKAHEDSASGDVLALLERDTLSYRKAWFDSIFKGISDPASGTGLNLSPLRNRPAAPSTSLDEPEY